MQTFFRSGSRTPQCLSKSHSLSEDTQKQLGYNITQSTKNLNISISPSTPPPHQKPDIYTFFTRVSPECVLQAFSQRHVSNLINKAIYTGCITARISVTLYTHNHNLKPLCWYSGMQLVAEKQNKTQGQLNRIQLLSKINTYMGPLVVGSLFNVKREVPPFTVTVQTVGKKDGRHYTFLSCKI